MKKSLIVTAGAAVMAFGMSLSAMAADVPTDYEAYFTFDESTDGTTADGSVSATPVLQGANTQVGEATDKTFNYVDGMNGKAIEINDNGDNIGLDTNVTLNGTDAYTVSFWAKADNCVPTAPLVWIGGTNQPANGEDWVSVWSGFTDGTSPNWKSHTGIGSNDAAGTRVGYVAQLSENDSFGWTYITLTVDESQMASIYYNGVLQGTTESAVPVLEDGAHVYVGANAWDDPAHMEIDDLAIFKRVLSKEEIQALYEVKGIPSADAEVVEYEETTTPEETTTEKKKVSTAAGGVATVEEESDSSTGMILAIVVIVLVVAVVAALVIATRKKKS